MVQKYASKTSSCLVNHFWCRYRLHIVLALCPIMLVYLYEVLQKRGQSFTDSSKCQLGGKPSTPCLTSSASGHLATSMLTFGLKLHLAPAWLGSGELVCKVQIIQFQLKYTWVHVPVKLFSQARIGVLEHELRSTWTWVVVGPPLFRRTSSRRETVPLQTSDMG